MADIPAVYQNDRFLSDVRSVKCQQLYTKTFVSPAQADQKVKHVFRGGYILILAARYVPVCSKILQFQSSSPLKTHRLANWPTDQLTGN